MDSAGFTKYQAEQKELAVFLSPRGGEKFAKATAENIGRQLAIVWHGRYVNFFEEASAELGRKCGLTYEIMQREGIAAPIAQLHIDYYHPLRLSEICTIQASLIWSEASRLNIEYLISGENGSCACCGYTVQMFVHSTGEVCLLSPDILVKCRTNWQNGMFHG